MEQDFCYDERKSKQDELKSLKNKNFYPCFIYENDTLVGYICYWDFDGFIFGEHFAILEEIRDKGWGTKFLKQFLSNIKKPFVFEMEKPIDEQSKMRMKFYQRLNLVFNDYDYIQPPYHENGHGIPMIFVSYPKALSKKDYNIMVEKIKKEVYNLG